MNILSMLIAGLSLGAVYALVALGIVILYKASETLNFAHGSLVVLGAYVTARTFPSLGFWPAALAGILAAAVMGVVVERLLVRPMRDAPVVSLAIMTIGVEILINTDLVRRIGVDILPLGHPWGAGSAAFGGVVVPLNRMVAIVAVAAIVAVFLLAFRFSAWGISMRAAAEDREAAELVGLNLGKIALISWLVAGALAAVAGIFLTGAPTPGLAPALATVAWRAFPAAIIGGLDSPGGALVGGLVVGMVEALAVGFQDELAFLGRGVGDVLPYAAMLVVLVVRPQGLFSRREVVRV